MMSDQVALWSDEVETAIKSYFYLCYKDGYNDGHVHVHMLICVGPTVKCVIPEFRHGIVDVLFLVEKDFIAIIMYSNF